jgi:hypothetical protein
MRRFPNPARLGFAAALVLGLAVAIPSAASANLDSGDGQWAPGRALIKFDAANMRSDGVAQDQITSEIGSFVRKSLKAKIVATLPLISNAYTIEFEGKVPGRLAHLAELDRQEHGKPWIVWEQPDYVAHLKPHAGPSDPAYWPNDPYFWPRTWANQNGCPGNQIAMGQVNLWPLYRDLRDPSGPWAANNPTPTSVRPALNYRQIAASSIDVLPVWDALGHKTQGRSGGNGQYWLPQDVQRSGIAIWDSGIANNPDVAGQVAAMVGVGKPNTETDPNTELNVAYGRGADFKALRDEFVKPSAAPPGGVKVASTPRAALFPLDDVTKDNSTPTGCDGHGTEVASVAGAAAANRQGIAGVGWNVPLVGIRPLRPWDDGQTRTVAEAQTLANHSARIEVYDDTLIDQFAVAKAFKIPVVNMSFGEQMFARRLVDAVRPNGKRELEDAVLVEHPAVVEALARGLADNETLGVASAGRGQYGTGNATGASLKPGAVDAAQAPCVLRPLLERGGLHVLLGEQKVAGSPGPVGRLVSFRVPGIDVRHLNLICVANARATTPALDPDSGSGNAAVDLAAPALNIPVATRPGGSQDPATWYRRDSGTSFAAAEVSGAAAVLREAAPGAPMNIIATALRRGARVNVETLRQVLYGQLDVACSALWLIQHAEPKWDLRITEAGLGASTQHCFQPSTKTETAVWTFSDSLFNKDAMFYAGGGRRRLRRFDTGYQLVRFLFSQLVNGSQEARDVQNARLLPDGVKWDRSELAFFPIEPGGFSHPVATPDRPIYDFNNVGSPDDARAVVCPAGTELIDINLRMKSFLPKAYVFASDDHNGPSGLFLNIAMVKPFLIGLVPDPIRVAVTYRCAVLPVGGG